MQTLNLQGWIELYPEIATALTVILLLLVYLLARLVFGRGLTYIATQTKTKYDDMVVKKLRPYRASLLAPFIILYTFSYLAPGAMEVIQKISLFFILWLSILTLNGLLDAFNQIYESTPTFTGVSIQGYLDIAKIFSYMVGIILSISVITGDSPLVLLGGLGALTAILLLVFHDTIMALVASVQISANNLVKEGDWLEVPAFEADGVVINMNLHTIKIQNWDKTIAVIPTHKIMDTAYRNWRGMQESGGRRIMRSISLDQNSIQFCSPEMINRYCRIDMIADYITKRRQVIDQYIHEHGAPDSPLDGPQITNVEIFRAYIDAYLKQHPGIHHVPEMDFVIRELAPTASGLPVEIYVFSKTTKWDEYECIQAEIIDHLIAAAAFFDLRLFQQPAGSDFALAFRDQKTRDL